MVFGFGKINSSAGGFAKSETEKRNRGKNIELIAFFTTVLIGKIRILSD
jgi:hypothetical protein